MKESSKNIKKTMQSHRKAYVTVYLGIDHKKKLDKLASRQNRTLSNYISYVISKHLDTV